MKIEVKETKKEGEIKYPCLMISSFDHVTVLFIEENIGMKICEDIPRSFRNLGYFSTGWNMENFKPFHGTITLSND